MTLTVTAALGIDGQLLVSVVSSPAATDRLRVFRLHEDGSRHRVLVSDDLMVGTWDQVDYHAPFNMAVSYVAETDTQTSAASNEVYQSSSVPWLIHPSQPAKSIQPALMMVSEPKAYAGRAQLHQVLNSKLPVSRSIAPRAGEQCRLKFRVLAVDLDAALALFEDDSPILLNGPWGKHDYGWKWVQPAQLSVINPGGHPSFPDRWVEAPYEECAAPDAAVAAAWTIADLASGFASISAATAAYTTIRNMSLNVRV